MVFGCLGKNTNIFKFSGEDSVEEKGVMFSILQQLLSRGS